MANNKSRKPSLFAETKDPGQKKAGVLSGIESGVGNRSSNTSKILLLLIVLPIIVWLSYIAISKATAPIGKTDNLLADNTKTSQQQNQPKPIVASSTTTKTAENETNPSESSAKIIDEALPIETAKNDEDMVSSAFDSLEKAPAAAPVKAVKATKPKNKTKAKKTSRKTKKDNQSTTTTAEAGDVAVLQAMLTYKKVPSKAPVETSENKPNATNQQTTNAREEVNKEVPSPALAVPTSTGIQSTPQQALLSNELNNQELAATSGADKTPTIQSSTKNLIKQCNEMEELDAAICKWDVCDQYGGDESVCSEAFTKKKKTSRFKFLKYLGFE